jgi:hypothetical protein
MNISQIDIGSIANDGTGDDLRTAFQKINENFVELETSIDASTTADNVGTGTGLFKRKSVNTLEFKSLAVDDKLSIAEDGNTITISTNFAGKNLSAGSLVVTGSVEAHTMTASMFTGQFNGGLMGRVYPNSPDYIIGAGNINGVKPAPFSFFLLANQTSNSTTVVLRKEYRDSTRQIVPSSNVPAVGFFIVSGSTRSKILSVTDNGATFTLQVEFPITITGNINYIITEEYLPARVDGVSVKDLSSTINTFDFGSLDSTYTSVFPYMLSQLGLDMGTIISPTDVSVDAGTI